MKAKVSLLLDKATLEHFDAVAARAGRNRSSAMRIVFKRLLVMQEEDPGRLDRLLLEKPAYPGFGSKGAIRLSVSIDPDVYRRTLGLIGARSA
jgi:hypothetical protein